MKITKTTPVDATLLEMGQRLARVRKADGRSQQELAQDAGIGVATLRRIELGQSGQLSSWIKILVALGMTAELDAFLPEEIRSPVEEAMSRNVKAFWDRYTGTTSAKTGNIWKQKDITWKSKA